MASPRLNRSLRTNFYSMAANACLTAIKFAAGVLGHSHALMADAVESLADVLSSIAVWRGITVAAEPADSSHPYGHGKAEPIAAAFVAMMLLFAAVGIIARSTVGLFLESRLQPKAFTLYLLVAVIIVKECLYRFMAKEGGQVQNLALTTEAWHHRMDAVTSLAAAIGIGLAIFGGPRFAAADDAAAIIAGGIVAWNGCRLLRPALDELMDAAPSRTLVTGIRHTASKVEGVNAVEKCNARKMGFQYYVDMHVEVDPTITVLQGHQIAHNVKNKVCEAYPTVSDVLVHVEPSGQVSSVS